MELKTISKAGAQIAWQKTTTDASNNTQTQAVFFEHADASGMSRRATDASGAQLTEEGVDGAPVEADALGNNAGLSTPYIENDNDAGAGSSDYPDRALQILGLEAPTYVSGRKAGDCSIDGFSFGSSAGFSICGLAHTAMSSGGAAQCPGNNCGPQVITNSQGQTVITSPFRAYANKSGYWYNTWSKVNEFDETGKILLSEGSWSITGTFFRETAGGNTLFDFNRPNPQPVPTPTSGIAATDGHRDNRINHDDWGDYVPNAYTDCSLLAQNIRDITNSLKDREGWSWDKGHKEVWKKEQNGLRENLTKYYKDKCDDKLPEDEKLTDQEKSDAWTYQNMKASPLERFWDSLPSLPSAPQTDGPYIIIPGPTGKKRRIILVPF